MSQAKFIYVSYTKRTFEAPSPKYTHTTYTHAYTHTYIHVCIQYTHTRTYTCTYIIHICIYMRTHIHKRVYTIQIYIYTHALHIYTREHAHTFNEATHPASLSVFISKHT